MADRVSRGERYFPEKVYQFSPDVKELYFEGNLSLASMPAIALVGSRRCTVYGRTVTRDIGKRAAANRVTVVSGLAKGIDTFAHESTLENNGNTIAVLGGGTKRYYPAENRALQQTIGKEGLLLSEHPPAYQARAYDFPKRNRIISALSDSVAVIEAPNRSGALITAECAQEQGKNVYALPGNITSYYSFGTNKLIRDGAIPLVLIDDLFLDLGITPQWQRAEMQLGNDEMKVYSFLKQNGETTMDQMICALEMSVGELSGILTVLEMKGVIFSAMGKFFVANI